MESRSFNNGPLEGLNVIDLGWYYAGPLAAMLLADQGANVIRVVKPGIQELPDHQYRLLNRNKKIIELNLKNDDDRHKVISLIRKADVLIENFRPGVMDRLKLNYNKIKYVNPSLVYLSLPGFSSRDSERSHIQAWEGILSAAVGIFVEYNSLRERLQYPPLYTSLPHCSMYGGIHGATAIMAALLARQAHGFGVKLEVPLLDSGMSALSFGFTSRVNYSGQANLNPMGELPNEIKKYKFNSDRIHDDHTQKLGAAVRETFPPGVNMYKSKDGRIFNFWGVVWPEQVKRFYKILGIRKQLEKEGFVNAGPWEFDLENNISNPFHPMSVDRKMRLEYLTATAYQNKTLKDWETLRNRCPVGVICTREEWLQNKALLKTGLLAKMANGKSQLIVPGRLADVSGPNGMSNKGYKEAAEISFLGAMKFFSSKPGDDKPEEPRLLNEQRPNQLKGDLLSGLRVLDLANVMAGPMAGYVLGQYGAKVISANSIVNFPANQADVLEANMGKRSILIDVTTAPGREILRRLISKSDVLLHNILDHTAKRMGVSHDQLKGINSNLVNCQVSAFGATYQGGYEVRPGLDMSVQAETGLAANFGSLEWPQLVNLAAACDCLTGQSAAFAILLGIWEQRKTGNQCEVRTSLARANNYFQLPWMIAQNGKCDWGEARGQNTLGNSPWQRLYECKDRWIYIHLKNKDREKIYEIVFGKDYIHGEPVCEKLLETKFLEQDSGLWLAKLDAAGIACHKVVKITDFFDGARMVENCEAHEKAKKSAEAICWPNHPSGVSVVLPNPTWVRVGEDHSYFRCKPAPKRGEHTSEILRELDYSDIEIQEFINVKIVYEYQPEIGNKKDYFYNFKK